MHLVRETTVLGREAFWLACQQMSLIAEPANLARQAW